MSKKSKTKETDVKPDHLSESIDPLNFYQDMADFAQDYQQKVVHFISDRIEDDVSTAQKMMNCKSHGEYWDETNKWWHRLGQDYLSHLGNVLEISSEVKSEIDDLINTELDSENSKPEELFENSPV